MKKRFTPILLSCVAVLGLSGCSFEEGWDAFTKGTGKAWDATADWFVDAYHTVASWLGFETKEKKEDKKPEEGEKKEEDVKYTISITNKEEIARGEYRVGGQGPTLGLAIEPKTNINDLIVAGRITFASDNEEVATVSGKNVVPVAPGTAKITVKCDESSDFVDVTILEYEDPIKNKPAQVTAPVVGTEYKFGIEQYGLATPSMLYLKGKGVTSSNFYWATVTNFNEGVNVMVEEFPGATGDYHYALKVMEGDGWYLGVATSSNDKGDHINDTEEATPLTAWKWVEEFNTFVANVEVPEGFSKAGGDYYLGTTGSYNTWSFAQASNLGKEGNYPGHLYAIPEELVVVNTEITIISDLEQYAEIVYSKAQGEMTFTVVEGEDVVEVLNDGLVHALSDGTAVIAVSDGVTTINVTVTVRHSVAGETEDNPMTPAEAIEVCGALDAANKETSKGYYYVKGTVIDTPTADYCNFNMSDGTSNILAYGLWTKDGTKRYGTKRDIAEIPFSAGDEVEVYTQFQNYSGKLEMVNAKLWEVIENLDVEITVEAEHADVEFTSGVEGNIATKGETVEFTVEVDEGYELLNVTINGVLAEGTEGVYSFEVAGPTTIVVNTKEAGAAVQPGETPEFPMTPQQAIELAETLDAASKEQTTGKYYIEGVIVDDPTANYCNFHFDGTSTNIVAYGLWTSDGTQRYGTSRDIPELPVFRGDTALLHANLQNYNGTLEMTNAWLIDVEHAEVALTVEAEHATVTGVPESAVNGSTVNFTVSVASGYELVSVKVYGKALTAVEGTYSFKVAGSGTVAIETQAAGTVTNTLVDTFLPEDFTDCPGSYTTDGTEYNYSGNASYAATGINSGNNIRGNKSANGGNFNLRNTAEKTGYYISSIVITNSNTGTIDVATANRSVLILGTSVFGKITDTTVPTGTQVAGTADGAVYSWVNTNKSATSFILYSLKTSGTVTASSIVVTWTLID